MTAQEVDSLKVGDRVQAGTRTGIVEFVVSNVFLVKWDGRRDSEAVRPRMHPYPTCAALWLNTKGSALAYAAIGDIISRRSTERLGYRITPHDARDAAATTWAISAPDQIGVARDLLTHSDLRTTTKYYNRARGIEASRAHSQVIAGIRKKQNRRS
jgi:integrase